MDTNDKDVPKLQAARLVLAQGVEAGKTTPAQACATLGKLADSLARAAE